MIGVFDSGFGGLTVLRALVTRLPRYDYFYLGDSARAPYGSRSLQDVHGFTREAVELLFEVGCPLVLLACNTASAQALRTLQQRHLPAHRPDRRILGVVRPSAEALAGLPPGAIPGVTEPSLTSGTVGVLGTAGTIASGSYALELAKLAPRLRLVQQACPLWVPLVEAGETRGPGVDFFLRKYLDPLFARPDPPSRLLLGCTHYPLLWSGIRAIVPAAVEILAQGELVAERLADWLARHPEMERRLSRQAKRRYATTDDPSWFAARGEPIMGTALAVERVRLPLWRAAD
ncbi:MAG: glutamate racemase [Deltaproteobacteria bacterium]|jgi:glutamate racemase|nr:glutamate racemase [Deltaproteobacteria bacterium]